MEIELIARPVFDLKIGEAVFKEFTVQSEWEGFKKLSSRHHGTVIIALAPGMHNDLSKIFDFLAPGPQEAPKQKAVVIRAPADILAAVEREHAKGGAA